MSTFVKNLPAVSGWYWIKYQNRLGEFTVPCEVVVVGESTVVRTARGDAFTDKSRKQFGYSHALFGPKIEQDDYQRGVRAAASFAGSWDKQITGTPFKFEDVVLAKFNLLPKNKMRKKPGQSKPVKKKAVK